VTVKAETRYNEADTILRRNNAYDINTRDVSRSPAAVTPTGRTADSGGTHYVGETGQKVQLHEEQLRVQKQPTQAGEVRVHKEVHTEHQTVDVPVRREEVVIERRPASGRASASDFQPGEEIRIPVKEEQVKVEKETVLKEEVNIGKRQVQDT